MLAQKLDKPDRQLGKPKDWSDETPCDTLDIWDIDTENGNFMVSAWLPTEQEIKRLQNGEPMYLWIRGSEHPVVSLAV